MKRTHQQGKLLPRQDRMRFDYELNDLRTARVNSPFWEIYRLRAGPARRQALVAWLRQAPETPGGYPRSIPVNNRWQAHIKDPDLQYLLKKGVLIVVRGGGARRHPQNRTSSKRQTLLFLAEHEALRQAYVFQHKTA